MHKVWILECAAEENSLVIIAVAHHSRRPGYWSPRVLVVKG